MLIYVKNIKKKKLFTDRQTDGRTDGQPKTIVRNLTKLEALCYQENYIINFNSLWS